MASTPLSPEHALAYLRELQPGAREVALVGPGGALLAGEEGRPAAPRGRGGSGPCGARCARAGARGGVPAGGESRAPVGVGDELVRRVADRESQIVLGLDPDPGRLWPVAGVGNAVARVLAH